MLYLNDFKKENYKDYIDLYNEFIKYNSDLIPDILEIKCRSKKDYNGLLNEINNRLNGSHNDLDWYNDGHYYLVYDDNKLIGIGCIRNNLTKKGYDIWGNIAFGVRPTERKKGYGTKISKLLIRKAKDIGMDELIICHYESNSISPKILQKIGAQYINTVISPYSKKVIYRYRITIKERDYLI